MKFKLLNKKPSEIRYCTYKHSFIITPVELSLLFKIKLSDIKEENFLKFGYSVCNVVIDTNHVYKSNILKYKNLPFRWVIHGSNSQDVIRVYRYAVETLNLPNFMRIVKLYILLNAAH